MEIRIPYDELPETLFGIDMTKELSEEDQKILDKHIKTFSDNFNKEYFYDNKYKRDEETYNMIGIDMSKELSEEDMNILNESIKLYNENKLDDEEFFNITDKIMNKLNDKLIKP